MTVTHIYHDLPAELRGNNLESHSGWPRTWTTNDVHAAMRVIVALGNTITVGQIQGFERNMIVDGDTVTITLNRTFGT